MSGISSKGSILTWDDGPEDDEDSWIDEEFDVSEMINGNKDEKKDFSRNNKNKTVDLRKKLIKKVVDNGMMEIPSKPKLMRDNEKKEIKKKDSKLSYEERLAKDMARLMPVAGWKPEIENNEEEYEERRDNHYTSSKRDNRRREYNSNNNNNKTTNNKKTSKIKSMWENAEEEEEEEGEEEEEKERGYNNKHNRVEESREYYRQQKLRDRLEWDGKGNVIKQEEPREEDTANNPTKHSHFTYDNSKESNSKKDTKKDTNTNTKLDSIWA